MFRRYFTIAFISLFSLIILVGCSKSMETETKIGYISNINVDERTFDFDPIEWITLDNTKRVKELKLDEDDFPNAFYRYNPTVEKVKCTVDNPKFPRINPYKS